MNRRVFLKLGGAGFAALALPSAALAAPPPAQTAAEVVARYLSACRGNRLAEAHALLSPATQQMLPFKQFAEVKTFPDDLTTDGMTPILAVVSALFIDAANMERYQFRVVSAAPNKPNVVLVRARAPGMKTADILTLQIVAVPDSKAGGALRLDLMQTMQQTDPDGLNQSRDRARQLSSLSNLRQIGLALVMYAQGHDGRLPNADTWVDDITPVWEHVELLFRDPSVPGGQWNYAFNRALSGVKLADLKNPEATVMVFESTANVKNAADEGASVPRPGRHGGGTTYVFADGRAKWIADKETMPSFRPGGA